LSIHGDGMQYDNKLTRIEANRCQDLLNQADYHVKRTCQKDMEEREIRQNHKKKLELLRVKQDEDKAYELQHEENQKKEKLRNRQEYIEKTKNVINTVLKTSKFKRKVHVKKNSDYDKSFFSELGENTCPKKSKKR